MEVGSGAFRLEADLAMRAVAVGLVLRLSAAAQPGLAHPVDRVAGAADDFQVAGDLQRPILLWIHLERPAPRFQWPGFLRFAIAAGYEAALGMAVVAERLVLRQAAATPGGA